MSRLINPWDLGSKNETKTTDNFPTLCKANYLLVKLAHPKEKTIRDGLVGGFIMTSYYDDNGSEIKTVEAEQSPEGYRISFPLGKTGLYTTKFRGPGNWNKWKDVNGEPYIIESKKFDLDYAINYCKDRIPNWNDLSEVEKEVYIDQYYRDTFLLALSLDLNLPLEKDGFTEPVVGLRTLLYRVTDPPKQGERWPRITITKWRKDYPNLDGTFDELPESLATSIYEEWMRREEVKSDFDPTSFVEE